HIFCLCFFFVSTIAKADQVLFKTGPDQLMFDSNGHGLPSISNDGTNSFSATDIFTFTASSTIHEISFSAWVDSGVKPSSVSWVITSSPGSGTLFSGTGALTNTLTQAGVCGCDVYWSTFSVNIPLGPGTYWLLLSDGSPSMSWGLYKET